MTENYNQYNKIILDAYNRSKEIAKKEHKPNDETINTIASAQKSEDMFGSFNSVKECMKALKYR